MSNSFLSRFFMRPRLSVAEQIFFVKRLAFLITSGVPIVEALHMLKAQSSRALARVLVTVTHDVSNGQELFKSLGTFPHIFGSVAINLIQIGEQSGTLSQSLTHLAHELSRAYAVRRNLRRVFMYPALILVATLGITGFLMVYVFPNVMPVILRMGVDVPFTTRVVIASSTFLQHYGIWMVIVAVLLGVLSAILMRWSARFRLWVAHAVLRLPILGTLTRYHELIHMTRTLGLLLHSGVTLGRALVIVADTQRNQVYGEHVRSLETCVVRGETLSPYLARHPIAFPPILAQMVAVSERTGTLSATLIYLAEFYEQEAEDLTKNVNTLIEPVLMLFMGLIIGFIAISIITPLYGITQNLHP